MQVVNCAAGHGQQRRQAVARVIAWPQVTSRAADRLMRHGGRSRRTCERRAEKSESGPGGSAGRGQYCYVYVPALYAPVCPAYVRLLAYVLS